MIYRDVNTAAAAVNSLRVQLEEARALPDTVPNRFRVDLLEQDLFEAEWWADELFDLALEEHLESRRGW